MSSEDQSNIELGFRKVQPDELLALEEMARSTFITAFGGQNKASDMAIYTAKVFHSDHILSEFENPESAFYFVTLEDEPIGYLKLNTGSAQSEQFGTEHIEIERIYVLQKYQGLKIGQFLIKKALDIARRDKHEIIWLGVWEKNTRAIKFYKNHGFIPFDRHEFMLGHDLQTDILMRRKVSLNRTV